MNQSFRNTENDRYCPVCIQRLLPGETTCHSCAKNVELAKWPACGECDAQLVSGEVICRHCERDNARNQPRERLEPFIEKKMVEVECGECGFIIRARFDAISRVKCQRCGAAAEMPDVSSVPAGTDMPDAVGSSESAGTYGLAWESNRETEAIADDGTNGEIESRDSKKRRGVPDSIASHIDSFETRAPHALDEEEMKRAGRRYKLGFLGASIVLLIVPGFQPVGLLGLIGSVAWLLVPSPALTCPGRTARATVELILEDLELNKYGGQAALACLTPSAVDSVKRSVDRLKREWQEISMFDGMHVLAPMEKRAFKESKKGNGYCQVLIQLQTDDGQHRLKWTWDLVEHRNRWYATSLRIPVEDMAKTARKFIESFEST